MAILDILFSFEGKISRKDYIIFFLIFTLLFSFVVVFEVALGGIIYLSAVDKLLGNLHFLFFPILLLFLFVMTVITAFFITYYSYSLKRARDFSENPVQYVIYYTSLISLVTFIALIGNVAETYKTLIVSYILFFLPYLIFNKNNENRQH